MSGTTMSTPSNSASGNMRPASTTMMSSPKRMAMQFIPNSPSPPSGTMCSFPFDIRRIDASTGWAGVDVVLPRRRCRDGACPVSLGRGGRGGKPRLYGNAGAAPDWLVNSMQMSDEKKSWMRRRVEAAIRGGMKLAAAEGAGFGLGGILTIVPDLGILSAITMRTIQKLSLIFVVESTT